MARSLLSVLSVVACPALGQASEHVEAPLEIYSRIAQGALGCWFGSGGSLKRSHVFHADVPPGEGSPAEIVLHERDAAAQNPRSIRAYRVRILPTGTGSRVETENFKLPEIVARDLTGDVGRWSTGKTGCSVVGVGGWAAEARKDEPAATSTSTKTRKSRPKL